MKSKLFTILTAVCMMFTMSAMAKDDASWIKSTRNPAHYDNQGYKGPGDKIFVGIPLSVGSTDIYLSAKLVTSSYAAQMAEILYTLENSSTTKVHLQRDKWDLKHAQLWDHELEHPQNTLKGVTAGSRWYLVDNHFNPQTKRRVH